MRKSWFVVAALVVAGWSHQAFADAASNKTKTGTQSTDGAEIYRQVCQGCHMPGGKGAVGAGAFPALADDRRLASASYPIDMVLNGHGGMPWFGPMLNDTQVAAVVTYVRTHFGNAYADPVKPEDVAQQRGPNPTLER